MFTGIIERIGHIEAVEDTEQGRRLRIGVRGFVPPLPVPGDSISVDGACLTVVRIDAEGFEVDVIGTTLSRTIAGGYRVGTEVNLERAMRLGDRLDGHLVQGHVDGIGSLLSVSREGTWYRLRFAIPGEITSRTILHGSIAISGTSLTVNALGDRWCEVGIIPHTWEHTTLSGLAPGDRINVEGDMIGKYVARLVGKDGQ